MEKREIFLQEMKTYPAELITISKRRKTLIDMIKNCANKIDNIERACAPPSLINRDVNLVLEFIRENKKVTSTEIYNYLN